MPTVLDATVVNQAYQTSASARPQRLSNGWIVSAEYDSSGYIRFQVDKRGGVGFETLTFTSGIISTISFALASKGTNVYLLATMTGPVMGFIRFDATTVTNTDLVSTKVNFDTGFVSVGGGATLVINDAGTEIHGAHSAIHTTLTSSKNIRYAKGTIATNGSVVWSAVEQWTAFNQAGVNATSPSISVANGKPDIFFDYAYTAGTPYVYNIYVMSPSGLPSVPTSQLLKSHTVVYPGGTYAQSSPSAIFVTQANNGLANGRIWVAWSGRDATDTAQDNIRVSYSDDGGVTWSAMDKRTNGNTYGTVFPSITFNKNNEIFIVYQRGIGSGFYDIRQQKFVSSAWQTETTVKTGSNVTTPSTLVDASFSFTSPLFIYKDTAKVGFYGTWTVTTISVTQGSIGTKTSPSNVLTYAITTDGVMSSITEKVNGVTIGTKTATSGQSQIVGLTKEQWDAVKFGKYKDVTAGLNTLTIEMGTEIFTYTFDKRHASDADMEIFTRAIQDSANVSLPAKKSLVATAIRAKGGTVNDTDSLEVMAGALSAMTSGRKASGTVTSSATTTSILDYSGGSTSVNYVAFNMSNLPFIPSSIRFTRTDLSILNIGGTWMKDNYYYGSSTSFANSNVNLSAYRVPYVNGVVNIPINQVSTSYTWVASE